MRPDKLTVTLALPAEFARLCAQDNVQPEDVLRGFVAELCAIAGCASGQRVIGWRSGDSVSLSLLDSLQARNDERYQL